MWNCYVKVVINGSLSSFIGFDKVAELLIQKGADVNIVGDYGNTPLTGNQ